MEERDDLYEAFAHLVQTLNMEDFNNPLVIKKLVDDNLEEFAKLFIQLTSIDWESDSSIESAYLAASYGIYTINYIYVLQMVMAEQVENYEGAQQFYDIAFQTHKLINETTRPHLELTNIDEEIRQNISESREHIIQILNELNNEQN